MDQVDAGGGFWSVITIAGPIILALVIIVAMLRNRRSAAEKKQSEQAKRDQINTERVAEGIPPKTGYVSGEKN